MAEVSVDEIYSLIFKELEGIERGLDSGEEQISSYLAKSSETLNGVDLVLAALRSTRTSFEILRDEIEELHRLSVNLLKKKKGDT